MEKKFNKNDLLRAFCVRILFPCRYGAGFNPIPASFSFMIFLSIEGVARRSETPGTSLEYSTFGLLRSPPSTCVERPRNGTKIKVTHRRVEVVFIQFLFHILNCYIRSLHSHTNSYIYAITQCYIIMFTGLKQLGIPVVQSRKLINTTISLAVKAFQ